MEYCEGFRDWHKCFRCAELCSERCPLESGTAEERGFKLRLLSTSYHKDNPAACGKAVEEN